jgi:hypothetical protein
MVGMLYTPRYVSGQTLSSTTQHCPVEPNFAHSGLFVRFGAADSEIFKSISFNRLY